MEPITFSQACDALIRAKTAAGKSPYTIRNYRTSFAKLQTYLASDPPFVNITRDTLIKFFAWLHEEYVSEPDGAAPRGKIKLSPKSILNIHADLSALWRWAAECGFVTANLVRTIEPPDPDDPVIDSFSQADIERLLKACDYRKTWKAKGDGQIARPTAERDRLIILFLFDTGLRASELCNIKLSDLNMSDRSVKVVGKGNKERRVYFGSRTSKAVWHFVTPRIKDGQLDNAPLFQVTGLDGDGPFTRDVLGRLLSRIGDRAGVPNVYPHRFRHTFAINYLRNGGDLFTLQDLLGHTDLTMVRRYVHIAQTDLANAHRKASPVDNWRL
jgi:integrase/recombinase XerD